MNLVVLFLNSDFYTRLRNRVLDGQDDQTFLFTKDGALSIKSIEQAGFGHYQNLLVVCEDIEAIHKHNKPSTKFQSTIELLSNKFPSINQLFVVLHSRLSGAQSVTKKDQEHLRKCIQEVFSGLNKNLHFKQQSLDSSKAMDKLINLLKKVKGHIPSFDQEIEDFVQAIFDVDDITQKKAFYTIYMQSTQNAPKYIIGEQEFNRIWQKQPFSPSEEDKKREEVLKLKEDFEEELTTSFDSAFQNLKSDLAKLLNIKTS
jgi:hypothetical protein